MVIGSVVGALAPTYEVPQVHAAPAGSAQSSRGTENTPVRGQDRGQDYLAISGWCAAPQPEEHRCGGRRCGTAAVRSATSDPTPAESLPSPEEIEQARRPAGGWTKQQLAHGGRVATTKGLTPRTGETLPAGAALPVALLRQDPGVGGGGVLFQDIGLVGPAGFEPATAQGESYPPPTTSSCHSSHMLILDRDVRKPLGSTWFRVTNRVTEDRGSRRSGDVQPGA